ncbi:ABC transporter permease [Fulvivirga sp.]|uniref:ABC transporter permease n=1 Tax=Fulvivirga sp. TaxID=1931237 RepID=UPI0032ED297C
MLKSYLNIAVRNLKRFKVYTLINLFGLAMGLTVGILIILYVTDELGFDKFHTKGDRIYKIVTDNPEGGTMETNAWPVATILKDDYPEVEKVVYTRNAGSSMMVTYENKRYEHNLHYAGEDFFNIFTFEFVEGTPSEALSAPFNIVITEEMKNRYFGTDVVLGKTITIRDSLDFTITGVIKDVPEQSHIQFDMLMSFKSYEKLDDWFSYSEGWGNFNVRNYILLKEGADVAGLQQKSKGMYMDHVGDWLAEMGMKFNVELVPLNDIYLSEDIGNGFGPKGSMGKIYLVSGIAVFVLLLACINFINLTTARSIYRAKEVGLRKIVGSSRASLIGQFMSEAFILTLAALFIAAILIDVILPFFNQLMDKNYMLSSLFNANIIVGGVLLTLLVTLLSGYYPSVVLSGYNPVQVLKGKMQSSAKGVQLRRSLVVSQFFVSCGLVLATITVINQLDFMRNQDLGFGKEQVLVLDATRVPKSASHQAFKNAIEQLPSVEYVSFNNALPGRPGWLGQWAYPREEQEGEQVDTECMAVDHNYINALGLELIAGENFDPNKNMSDAVIINETTVKEMGWETPMNALGKKITSPSSHPSGTVIGVVKDFHGLGLQDEIWAQVMEYEAENYGRYYAVKFSTGKTSDLIAKSSELWKEYLGDYTYEYFFLDQEFDKQYKSEDRLMTVLIVFAVLTTLIAVIGLLGLVSFMVLSKTKEIGIRKVLGADTIGLAGLLSKEFAYLIVIANILIAPVVWYYGQQWLNDFAYHTEINPMIFVISLVSTLFIALVTVSFQTIKAAQANPVNTLRGE